MALNKAKIAIDGIEYVVFQMGYERQLALLQSVIASLGESFLAFLGKSEEDIEKMTLKEFGAAMSELIRSVKTLPPGALARLAKEAVIPEFVKTGGAPVDIQKQVYKTGDIKHLIKLVVGIWRVNLSGFSSQGLDAPTSGLSGGDGQAGHSARTA